MNHTLTQSRLPGFYKQEISERLRILKDRKIINETDYYALSQQQQIMQVAEADRLIENVIGVFSMPIGLGLNFRINGKPRIVPLVVEEASIVAALSSAAKTMSAYGGISATATKPILIGQVQVMDVPHMAKAQQALTNRRDEILNLANSLHPRMVARGGGAQDIEYLVHTTGPGQDMLVVHLLVDTRDAMGANLVNSMCEGVAPLIEKITGGRVFLRILSNLCDRSMVNARVQIALNDLSTQGYTGTDVRDGIIRASEFARIDPYRAATHNKGIMNGIDALAIATGNDWRSIEAAAHAFAARGRQYTSLSRWYKGDAGDLIGEIELPLKVGIVGGPLQSNQAVGIHLRMLNVQSATELAQIMAAVGLAQNFSALRALVTRGIQHGHMTLHARSVTMAAGAPPELFEAVVEQLVKGGEIKIWRAEEIISDLQQRPLSKPSNTEDSRKSLDTCTACAKIILLGEHAVVYGSHAIAAPVPLAISAQVESNTQGIRLLIPPWGVEKQMDILQPPTDSLHESLAMILNTLGLNKESMTIKVIPKIPRAMGLGGSAAVAVAIIRALMQKYQLCLNDEAINQLAFRTEKIAHGTPSGVDNTVATFGRFILFRKDQETELNTLVPERPIPVVLGITGVESLTAKMVLRVRQAWQGNRQLYERIFKEIDTLTLAAAEAIREYNLDSLGEYMNINQGLLNALQVSTREIEELIQIAREAGACGAKLTGAGGGGTIVALCPQSPEKVVKAIQQAGYLALSTEIQ